MSELLQQYDLTLVPGWSEAKKDSPSRSPYGIPYELAELRVEYAPGVLTGVNAREATVIWTLLDMLEELLGFRVLGDPNV